jgi:NAD(P)-dependent dehydrogenase (short-subunit alcohol dehydrogenase family)
MNIFSVDNKVIIVTGASGGIGSAMANGLEAAGAIIIRADLPEVDVTKTKDLDLLVSTTIHRFNKIDGLINCAGITRPNNLFDYTDEDWENTYKVNLKAPYELTKRVALQMKSTGGSIINITSLNAEFAFPDNPAYVSTKGGVKQLTKSLALDLGKYGIRVNNIGPGYIRTNMTKYGWANNRELIENRTALGRWGEPSDFIGVAIFLLSDASSYITGQDIYVDGGYLIKGL